MSNPVFVRSTELRAAFAERLSTLYGNEVPAYNTLLATAHEVNQTVLARDPDAAQRLGSIGRVTAERHGAIRVGTPRELREVSRIFAAMGMSPVGFYDLRDAQPTPIPVISTAFRPRDRDELAANPFRVFTSLLATDDRRFFSHDLQRRLEEFLGRRRLFPDALLSLAERAVAEGGLPLAEAERFLAMATGAFALSSEPVDRAWYAELEQVSSVAADIGGVATTHINHLTPRVLDIDELYSSMSALGIEMIDAIQGPPRWSGPDVLLRQTSFRALAEPRLFRLSDGTVTTGHLRVRFGEVEARGMALTPNGRRHYDALVGLVDEAGRGMPPDERHDVASALWTARLPLTEEEWHAQDLAYFTYDHAPDAPVNAAELGAETVEALISRGWVDLKPIVYEDFLPRSAAGIFSSNLSGNGTVDDEQGAAARDIGWLSDVIGAPIDAPEDLYAAEREQSLTAVRRRFRITHELR